MSIENRGESKWRFRVRRDGVSYTQTFYGTEKEAINEHKKFEVDVMRGQIGYDENMKFSALSQIVMDNYVKPFTSENTITTYLYCYNNYTLDYFGNMKLSKIKQITVQKFINDISKKLSYSTVKQILSKLKATFNKAIEWKIIRENPCISVDIPNKEKSKNYIELLSAEEISQLVLAIENMKSLTFKTINTIAFGMGMRQSEILGLTINDIDFEKNIIDINKQYVRYQENNKYVRKISKLKTSNSYRKIYMPNYVKNLLKDYIDSIKVINLKEQYLFINPKTNKQYVHSVLSSNFTTVLKKNNLKHISFHDLRHLHATMLINSGVNIVSVAKRLGDTVETVSNTYLHSIDKVDKESVEMFDNFLKKSRVN